MIDWKNSAGRLAKNVIKKTFQSNRQQVEMLSSGIIIRATLLPIRQHLTGVGLAH
jgi:hypothetical protein